MNKEQVHKQQTKAINMNINSKLLITALALSLLTEMALAQDAGASSRRGGGPGAVVAVFDYDS